MLDLYHATRHELMRIILEQRDTLADRERDNAALKAELTQQRAMIAQLTAQVGVLLAAAAPDDEAEIGTPRGMPGLKPTEAAVRDRPPRRKRATGSARRRMQATDRVIHALATCPDCGAPLAGGSVKRTREVIELPPPQVIVTEHVYIERGCPDCGKRCVPSPDLGAVVRGQGRIGHGLSSLLAVLREEARLPIGMIQRLLATLTGLHLSVGAIVDSVAGVAARAQPVVTGLAETIRASPVVHLDETGWREAGRNGYVWTYSTPQIRLFRYGRRTKDMVPAVVGDQFGGVLVSDFYAAYTGYEGLHQDCWVHLLRDIHDLTGQHPDDAAVQGWAAAVREVFTRAQAGASGERTARWSVRKRAEAALKQLCTPWLEPKVAQTVLCQRILTHLASLFVFVTEPGVPATNNAAERSLRPVVVARKISGGTRSARGTTTKMVLASLFGTWRVQGRNPYDACHDLLASPQL